LHLKLSVEILDFSIVNRNRLIIEAVKILPKPG
jgi:hypothetical protein